MDLGVGQLSWQGVTFTPTVTWIRHFSMRAAQPVHGKVPTALLRDDSWEALVEQLSTISQVTIGSTAPGQLRQLVDAARLGIRVPRTVVLSNPGNWHEPPWTGSFIAKVMDRHYIEGEPGHISWFHPRRVSSKKWAEFTSTQPTDIPYILQEYVAHRAEIRLYLIGKEFFSFSVKKTDPSDIWLAPGQVSVDAVTNPPPGVLEAARLLADTWGLRYGAFDLLIDDDGPVFLEVNAHGDWRWYEQRANVDAVSRLASRFTALLHRSTRPDPSRFDLLTFLGARTGFRPLQSHQASTLHSRRAQLS
ncbi:RimK family alpha-L-glutamate ligase [Streptomyces sp. NPDC096354]|uniref:ATP-grasp domain-containing protein n=1 Tax=Streptomyces sp. NPDC096354 TaxID=3366088 RepID=UPI0038214E5D